VAVSLQLQMNISYQTTRQANIASASSAVEMSKLSNGNLSALSLHATHTTDDINNDAQLTAKEVASN